MMSRPWMIEEEWVHYTKQQQIQEAVATWTIKELLPRHDFGISPQCAKIKRRCVVPQRAMLLWLRWLFGLFRTAAHILPATRAKPVRKLQLSHEVTARCP
uniref:Uncharacterized protein n=1 Tax=Hyaloperonospora arabidopsidis (strain Emoy2) TaxID=559515 RepID=M4BK68_HYAAE